MAMTALVALRWRRPDIARPYKVPLVIPIIVLVFSIFLVVAPIVNEPKVSAKVNTKPLGQHDALLQVEYLYSLTFMALGGLLFVPFVSYKMRMPFIGEHFPNFFC
jgi:L-type amino acid transporter 9